MWSVWWLWMVAALVIGFLEVLAPAQIFLGFALGAAITGLALLVGIPGLATSLPLTLLLFAVMSLVSWLVVRKAVGVRPGQVKVWERDINED